MRRRDFLRTAGAIGALSPMLQDTAEARPSTEDGLAAMQKSEPFRPPSVPLLTFSPYFSVWSAADRLTDRQTQHWTGREHALASFIRVDGHGYRLMGGYMPGSEATPALPQVGLRVTPTRSIYDFEDSRVHVTVTFMRPALPNDLEAMALPVNYISWEVRCIDGEDHAISLYQSISSQLAVNEESEKVTWGRETAGDLIVLHAGTVDQAVLESSGDNHRINWGYIYAAALDSEAKAAINSSIMKYLFVGDPRVSGSLLAPDDTRMPRAVDDEEPVLAFVFDLGTVSKRVVTRQLIVAYDEIYAIDFFGQKLRPYWRRRGASPTEMLNMAARNYPAFARQCSDFDASLMSDAEIAGGEKYSQLCALAYRQCAAGCGLAADANGQPLFFTKENSSGGFMATVDVLYPMAAQWLLLSPTLLKATLVPILSYSSSARWNYPFAPHDIGSYPIAKGAAYGEGMPLEETANMLILCDAVAQAEGNAGFVSPWWATLTRWAEYLKRYGLDPGDQLCTDDFMGHLAHNANLAVKAILGLACYGDLCRRRGDAANADIYAKLAKVGAVHWTRSAVDHEHYRLAFDQPHTWSQKYNLVWDRILGLNVFPPEVAQQEVEWYKSVMERYGVPLDFRTKLTAAPWTFFIATLAEQRSDFKALISPMYDYCTSTAARLPFPDFFFANDVHSVGPHARPVIGSAFIKMLADRNLWSKWAGADASNAGNWAPLPDALSAN
jgi:hypothetical protein